MLTADEHATLLRHAREAIVQELTGVESPAEKELTPALLEPCGVFVTLHRAAELRGCIGYIEGHRPLIEGVRETAVKSAFEDPRFPPLGTDELAEIKIEISVLSPLQQVRSFETIEVGKHGLVLEFGGRRGLLLPQVAVENSWDRETFLQNIGKKAGCASDAWKHPGAKLFTFTAEVFGEEEFSSQKE